MNIDEKQKLLELEEHLILEVHAREPLWNPQIELSLRSRKATAQLWKEVSEALNGKQNIYSIRKLLQEQYATLKPVFIV